MRFLFFIVILFTCVSGHTKEKNTLAPCPKITWPFAVKQSKEDLRQLMNLQKRELLYFYFFNEVSNKERLEKNSEFAKNLSFYLTHTEANKDARGFLKAVSWASHLDEKGNPTPVDFQEVCSLYRKVKLKNPALN